MHSKIKSILLVAAACSGLSGLASAQDERGERPGRNPANSGCAGDTSGSRLPVNNEPYVKQRIVPGSGDSPSNPKPTISAPVSTPQSGYIPGIGKIQDRPTYGPPAPTAPVKPPPKLGSLEVPMPQTTRPVAVAPVIQPKPPAGTSTQPREPATVRPPPAASGGRSIPSGPGGVGGGQRPGGGGGYGNRTK